MTVQEWLGEDNKLGIDICERKYIFNNETVDELIDRLSGGDPILKRLLEEKKFMFGGRTTANLGTGKKASMMNCYSRGFIEDSLDDILQANTDIGLTFKTQGGQGLSLSKLRPKGCGINGGQFESDGIIPFMELYNRTTESISQGGSRKGALLIGLDIWHKEAEDFIRIKSEEGRIQKANLSLEIDNDFMECVEKYYETGEVITRHIVRDYNGNKVEYDVTPINLYKLMMEKAYDWAEPGCIFTDEFRNYNMMEYCDDYAIEICNPCVTGDTKVLTESGHIPIIDLIGKEVNIWNGFKFTKVVPKLTAKDQAIYEVKMSNGSTIKCTPYHKFILKDGSRVECKDLVAGTKLQKCEFPIINGEKIIRNPYTQGFFSGDGFVCADRNAKYISFYGDHKKPLSEYCAVISRRETSDIRDTYSVDVEYGKEFVPDGRYTIESKIEWLAGIVDADGSNNLDGSIAITSIDETFIRDIFFMLETLGVSSTYSLCKDEGIKRFPENCGGKAYAVQPLYRIVISSSDVIKLNKLGFNPHRVDNKSIPNREAKRFVQVVSVTKLDSTEDVYCFTEEDNHSAIFNGIYTAQCGEQPLAKNSACDLGSINLSEFVIDPFTKEARFDFKDFAVAIRAGVRALDRIIDENLENHALQEQRDMSLSYRNIGLGTMGMWDMLCKLNMKYGSEESKRFIDDLFYFMFRHAVIESSDLAREKGAFPKYTPEVLKSRIIQRHFSDSELDDLGITTYGLRNCSLLSIAPTGSIGTMFNISTGCEPAFQISYKRKTESLKGKDEYYDVYIGIAKEYMEKFNTDKLPDTFITAGEIEWRDRIDMQACIQKHIDTAISSTVNLPNGISCEEIEQLYLYAWKSKLKGVTIFRDGCKRTGILSTGENKETEETDAIDHVEELPRGYIIDVDDDNIGLKRKIITGCGSLHVNAVFDPVTGELLETFLSKGSQGGCLSNLTAVSRLLSHSSRGGIDVYSLADQLSSCPACPAYVKRSATKGDTSPGRSCPDAIAKTLVSMYQKMQRMICDGDESEENVSIVSREKKTTAKKIAPVSLCPECGATLIQSGGCMECRECGWTKCD